jgi:trehalose-phosphatase
MVWELRPDLDWDKGRAVLWILAALGLDRPDVVPVYLGDDVTDEDAFRALAEPPGPSEGAAPRDRTGIGILVAEEPRETAARFVLRDPAEVRSFLADFAEEPRVGLGPPEGLAEQPT